MALFQRYAMVDWSAASKPTTGKDSIWVGLRRQSRTSVKNIPTRHAATEHLKALALDTVSAGERLLIGFDFPFGYPSGVAAHVTGSTEALLLWDWLHERIKDDESNASNRFEVAAEINRLYPGIGPFWGRPESWNHPDIPTRASARTGDHPPERRLAERAARGAKTVWQLAYAGSVGSQVLVGLPRLNQLRLDPELRPYVAIWPFETGLAAPDAQVVIAEIYPSLIPPDPTEPIKDAGQVRAVADWLARLDTEDALGTLFAGPIDASRDERDRIATEEAWILGLEAALDDEAAA